MSKQINWIDFALKCIRNWKNISIYTYFGRNHLIVLINDYDEMVHQEPFHLNGGRLILMEDLDLIHIDKRYIMHLITAV